SVENLGNGVFNLSAEENWNGEATVMFSVRDSVNQLISSLINLSVLSINDAPVQLNDIEDQSWEEDSSKVIDISSYFSDPEGDEMTYEVYSISDNNISVENLGNGVFNLSAEENWDGQGTITFEISDENDSIQSNEIYLFVGSVNHNPVLDIIDDKYYFSGQLVSIIPSATDVDGDTIVYSYSTPLNSSGQWQTNIGDEGSYMVTVEARDGIGGIDNQSFFIYIMPRAIINEISINPKWVEIYNKNSIEINLNECYLENKNSERLNLSSIIPGNSFVSFNWDKLSSDWDRIKLICMNENIDEGGYGNGMLLPSDGQSVGRMPDGSDTNQESDFKLINTSTRDLPNSADVTIPIVTLTNPQSGETFTTRDVTFGFQASDNSESLVCELYTDTGGVFSSIRSTLISLIGGTWTGNMTIESVSDGTYTWNVKCSDSLNSVFAQNNRTFILSAPDSPVFIGLSDQTISENQTITFKVNATDQDNEILTYTAENLPNGSIFENQIFSWTPNFNQSGYHSVKFTVKDTSGLSATKVVKINVANVNIPPAFNDVKCENKSDKIEIKINNPKSGDDFSIDKNITVEIKVKNNMDETLKGTAYAYLYNLDEDKYLADEKTKVNLKKGESENYEIEIEIPKDIDDSDKFAILVIVEDGICNLKYNEISLEREEDAISIERFYINPSPAEKGEIVDFNVKVKNIGTEEQEGLKIKIENSDLDLSLTSESFDLEEYDEDDTATKMIEWNIPEDIENGEYKITATISFEGKKVIKEATLKIESYIDNEITPAYNESEVEVITPTENQPVTIEYVPEYTDSTQSTQPVYEEEILAIYSEETNAETVNAKRSYQQFPEYLNQPVVGLLLKMLSVLLVIGIIVFIAVIIKIYRSRYY
ncbi:MAG TPA: tandem-95 repeat protein, partial [Candidatus Paceibacterota bacterium]|nr:tandem-95 repeat protein [Candidatus Paceibacterota bacterium]